MYKTVYKNIKTGAVIAESFDEEKAFIKAMKASISISIKGIDSDEAKMEAMHDAFMALEDILWIREDVEVFRLRGRKRKDEE